MMAKFSVTVYRVVREDTTVFVEAENVNAAREKAQLEATSVPQENWHAYECAYWSDLSDVERLTGVPSPDEDTKPG